MADITYVEDFEQPQSSKGKSPWITVNKEDIADSTIIIEYIADKLGKDLDKNLSTEEKAIARGFRVMLEEHFFWCFLTIEFVHNNGKYMRPIFPVLPVPGFLQGFAFNNFVLKTIKKQAHAQGTGRHSQEEAERIGLGHLQALADYLGDKPFFFGNEPTLLDCVVFAFCSLFLACYEQDPIIFKKKVEEDMPNLKAHFERMKEKYWSDWDEKVYVDEKAKKKEEEAERKKKEEEEKKKKEEEEKEKKEEGKDEEKKDEDKDKDTSEK